MPSDKDTLLGMGFDPARVECSLYAPILGDTTTDLDFSGAIKASGGSGLQPAMDHIFENEGRPVPDLDAAGETSEPSSSQTLDEGDLAALQNLGAKGTATAAVNATQAEAKVRIPHALHESSNGTILEYQVFGVRQDLQKCSPCKLPCRKEWPRSV